jgi:hypothetical protein
MRYIKVTKWKMEPLLFELLQTIFARLWKTYWCRTYLLYKQYEYSTEREDGFHSTRRYFYLFPDSKPTSWKPNKQIQRIVLPSGLLQMTRLLPTDPSVVWRCSVKTSPAILCLLWQLHKRGPTDMRTITYFAATSPLLLPMRIITTSLCWSIYLRKYRELPFVHKTNSTTSWNGTCVQDIQIRKP